MSRTAKALLLLVVLFFAITSDLLAGGPLTTFDVWLANWLRAHGSPLATHVLLFVTHAHAHLPILVYSALFAGWLAWKRQWHWVLAVLIVVPAGLGINHLLKLLFERARPKWDDPLLSLSSYSFPSGHAAGAALFYGVLTAYLLTRLPRTRQRADCILVAATMVGLVGLSRMYLGVHYLSDVLAAVCSSLAWLVLCLAGLHAAFAARPR